MVLLRANAEPNIVNVVSAVKLEVIRILGEWFNSTSFGR
jgi:hypothetical protein